MTYVMDNSVDILLYCERIFRINCSVGTNRYHRSTNQWDRREFNLQLYFSVIIIDYR